MMGRADGRTAGRDDESRADSHLGASPSHPRTPNQQDPPKLNWGETRGRTSNLPLAFRILTGRLKALKETAVVLTDALAQYKHADEGDLKREYNRGYYAGGRAEKEKAEQEGMPGRHATACPAILLVRRRKEKSEAVTSQNQGKYRSHSADIFDAMSSLPCFQHGEGGEEGGAKLVMAAFLAYADRHPEADAHFWAAYVTPERMERHVPSSMEEWDEATGKLAKPFAIAMRNNWEAKLDPLSCLTLRVGGNLSVRKEKLIYKLLFKRYDRETKKWELEPISPGVPGPRPASRREIDRCRDQTYKKFAPTSSTDRASVSVGVEKVAESVIRSKIGAEGGQLDLSKLPPDAVIEAGEGGDIHIKTTGCVVFSADGHTVVDQVSMTGMVTKFGLGKQKFTQGASETRTIAVVECKEDHDNLRKLAGPSIAAAQALARGGITVGFDGIAPWAGAGVQPALPPLAEGGAPRRVHVHVSFTRRLSTGDWKMLIALLALRGGIKEAMCLWCEATQDDVDHDFNAKKCARTFLGLHLASHNPDPEVLAEAGKRYPYECPCCKEVVEQAVDPDGVSDDADMAHARTHHGSRLGRRPLIPGSVYRADGVTLTEITDLIPVEFLHYKLRLTELVFGGTILDNVGNKEIQKELAWFLRGNGIRVKIPIATRGKAANPKILKITFNGNTCDNLVQPSLYKQLVARFGGHDAAARGRGLQVWDALSALVKCVDAGAQLADTTENGHAQAATYGQARGALYTSLIAVIGVDRVNASWYSHGSIHMEESFKAHGPDMIQFCNQGVEMVNKMRKMEVTQHSSLKPGDRPVAALRGEVVRHELEATHVGLKREHDHQVEEDHRGEENKRHRREGKENAAPAAAADGGGGRAQLGVG